ncbi:hypothetical protein VNI00_019402, partial [Paramarasmius palmivorus]
MTHPVLRTPSTPFSTLIWPTRGSPRYNPLPRADTQHSNSSLASGYAGSDEFIAPVVPEAIARVLDEGE